jgi:hypothetical protein
MPSESDAWVFFGRIGLVVGDFKAFAPDSISGKDDSCDIGPTNRGLDAAIGFHSDPSQLQDIHVFRLSFKRPQTWPVIDRTRAPSASARGGRRCAPAGSKTAVPVGSFA